MKYNPTMPLLATAGGDDFVIIWYADSLRESKRVELPSGADGLAWSPDGTRLAIGAGDDILIYNVEDARVDVLLSELSDSVSRIGWSQLTGLLAALLQHDDIAIVDTRNGSTRTYSPPLQRVSDVDWSPDKDILAIGGVGANVLLWNVDDGSVERVRGFDGGVGAVKWSPSGEWLAIGEYGGRGRTSLWNAATRRVQRVLKGHSNPITSVCWYPRSNSTATGSSDTKLKAWCFDGNPANPTG